MHVRPATIEDIPFIDALRRREWEKVGFLPLSRYEQMVERGAGTLLIVEENGEPAGFLCGQHGFPLSSVVQLAIAEDARRITLGSALLDQMDRISRDRGRLGLKCRVAVDLEAHQFWQASGFEPVAVGRGRFLWKPSANRSREVVRYERLHVPRMI